MDKNQFWFEKIKRPLIGLAPMHQVSRADLRKSAIKGGADFTYSEMVSSEAIVRKIPQVLNMIEFDDDERPYLIQIFGNDPKVMGEAASFIEETYKPDGIDINFGCPVQKAEKQGFGSCQLSDIENSSKIIKEVSRKLKKIPLSIKIRIPSKDHDYNMEFVKRMVQAGIQMIAIHGRLPSQKYKGISDWKFAYSVKSEFPDLLVIGNGDIKNDKDVKEKIKNLDGVLIGREAKRDQEIFSKIKAML